MYVSYIDTNYISEMMDLMLLSLSPIMAFLPSVPPHRLSVTPRAFLQAVEKSTHVKNGRLICLVEKWLSAD